MLSRKLQMFMFGMDFMGLGGICFFQFEILIKTQKSIAESGRGGFVLMEGCCCFFFFFNYETSFVKRKHQQFSINSNVLYLHSGLV